MTTKKQAVSLPPGVENALEARLSEWAARCALSPLEAESILQAVLAAPQAPTENFTFAWWNRLFREVAAPVRQAADVRRYVDLRRVLTLPALTG
jgi:hypothetical protein